jgi:hypothetical protein
VEDWLAWCEAVEEQLGPDEDEPEDAALAGRELPPDEVFAVEQRIAWWAGELKKAGLEGGTDELRARALLDLLLGKDSRPGHTGAALPGGFAGRVTLTVPLATAVGLADRPGEIPGIGPIDPDPGANTLDCYQAGVSRPRYPAHQSTSPLPPQGPVTCARHVH